jgi:hypothetical protein
VAVVVAGEVTTPQVAETGVEVEEVAMVEMVVGTEAEVKEVEMVEMVAGTGAEVKEVAMVEGEMVAVTDRPGAVGRAGRVCKPVQHTCLKDLLTCGSLYLDN